MAAFESCGATNASLEVHRANLRQVPTSGACARARDVAPISRHAYRKNREPTELHCTPAPKCILRERMCAKRSCQTLVIEERVTITLSVCFLVIAGIIKKKLFGLFKSPLADSAKSTLFVQQWMSCIPQLPSRCQSMMVYWKTINPCLGSTAIDRPLHNILVWTRVTQLSQL